MTLDLVFVGADAGRAALAQLTAELGVTVRLRGQRGPTLEICPVSVLTLDADAAAAQVDATASWFARRGIHRLPVAA